MTHKGIKISGNGMPDDDGDRLWITIETPDTEIRVEFPADKSELLAEAFQCAIAQGLKAIKEDRGQCDLSPIIID